MEERKQIRANAKEIQLQEQRIKAAKREEAKLAQEVDKQIKEDLKQAREGKKKVLQPTAESPEAVVEDISLIAAEMPAPAVSRRGRKIALPKRFLS